MLSQRTKGYIAGAVASCSYGLNPLMAVPLFAMGMASYSMLFSRHNIGDDNDSHPQKPEA